LRIVVLLRIVVVCCQLRNVVAFPAGCVVFQRGCSNSQGSCVAFFFWQIVVVCCCMKAALVRLLFLIFSLINATLRPNAPVGRVCVVFFFK
jgi:hypothetical protein